MRNLLAAVVVTAGLSCASAAGAAVDVQNLFYSGGTVIDFNRISATQTIAGFDTSKGTLTSVVFEVSGSETVDVTPRAVGTLPYTIQGGSSLYFGNSFVDFTQTGSGTETFAAAPISLSATVSGMKTYTGNLLLFTSGDLSSYVRSDSPQVRIDGDLVGASPSPPVVSGTAITVKLSYIYDAVTDDVPEPATWMTMIAGFGMVGGALRRSRRPVAQGRRTMRY